ncbi:MAG: hypothetical protein LWW95_08240 [Candidatus Desulfofervidus auxilii]|nr:hypothetical protein [Candidatus Desulfofervidus auxilii]
MEKMDLAIYVRAVLHLTRAYHEIHKLAAFLSDCQYGTQIRREVPSKLYDKVVKIQTTISAELSKLIRGSTNDYLMQLLESFVLQEEDE